MVVTADEFKTNFVIFDRDTRKLTNKTAEEINLEATGTKNGNGSAFQEIPECITELVGNKLEFQIKITKFNFISSYQSFTVSPVLKEIHNTIAEVL